MPQDSPPLQKPTAENGLAKKVLENFIDAACLVSKPKALQQPKPESKSESHVVKAVTPTATTSSENEESYKALAVATITKYSGCLERLMQLAKVPVSNRALLPTPTIQGQMQNLSVDPNAFEVQKIAENNMPPAIFDALKLIGPTIGFPVLIGNAASHLYLEMVPPPFMIYSIILFNFDLKQLSNSDPKFGPVLFSNTSQPSLNFLYVDPNTQQYYNIELISLKKSKQISLISYMKYLQEHTRAPNTHNFFIPIDPNKRRTLNIGGSKLAFQTLDAGYISQAQHYFDEAPLQAFANLVESKLLYAKKLDPKLVAVISKDWKSLFRRLLCDNQNMQAQRLAHQIHSFSVKLGYLIREYEAHDVITTMGQLGLIKALTGMQYTAQMEQSLAILVPLLAEFKSYALHILYSFFQIHFCMHETTLRIRDKSQAFNQWPFAKIFKMLGADVAGKDATWYIDFINYVLLALPPSKEFFEDNEKIPKHIIPLMDAINTIYQVNAQCSKPMLFSMLSAQAKRILPSKNALTRALNLEDHSQKAKTRVSQAPQALFSHASRRISHPEATAATTTARHEVGIKR